MFIWGVTFNLLRFGVVGEPKLIDLFDDFLPGLFIAGWNLTPPPLSLRHFYTLNQVAKSLHVILYIIIVKPPPPPQKIWEPQDNREHCITQAYFVS